MKRNLSVMPSVHRRNVTADQLVAAPVSKAMQNAVYDTTFTKVGTGRNDPCGCGSGRKFKRCCARRD